MFAAIVLGLALLAAGRAGAGLGPGSRALAAPPTPHPPQCESSLRGRWVGLHKNQTIRLEFYGDTMLVLDDQHPLNYRATADSLIATGDTAFRVRYWFSFCRLLLETADGSVITMAWQDVLARPLPGRWIGELGTPDGAMAELRLAPGGTARWRRLPDGPWQEGEWERETRIITFTWAADSIPWIGHYDPQGNAIVFERTLPNSHAAIFRRAFR